MVARRLSSRIALIALFGLFFLPIVIAWILNVYPGQWRPQETINHGTLVAPVRDIDTHGLFGVDQSPISTDLLEGKWTLMFLGAGGCQMECQSALYKMRQVRLALGKDMSRVQRVYALEGQTTSEGRNTWTSDPGVEVAIANEKWAAPFSVDGQDPWAADRVYLLDPEGRLVMYYGPNATGEGILEDLERLLKYSKIG